MNFAGPRAFARHMLATGVHIGPFLSGLHFDHSAFEGILYRNGQWQIELVILLPNVIVPTHRHNHVDSADLRLAGDGLAIINGRTWGSVTRGRLDANLLRVAKGSWHGGSAGPDGVAYLSFQQWDDEPRLISEDWEWQ